MRTLCCCLPLLSLAGSAVAAATDPGPFTDRWVYVARNLRQDAHVAEIERIVNTAADHGLNGMVLTGGFDTIGLAPPEYFTRLEKVKAICRRRGVEIIPILFSAGYGGGVLAHDPNLAAGLAVVDAPFVVREGEARPAPNPAVAVTNGGFEEWDGEALRGYLFHDRPGEISVPDREVCREGRTALRLQRVGELSPEHGHARVAQDVAVEPRRRYRVSVWVRTEGLQPAGTFALQAYSDEATIVAQRPTLPETGDWTQVSMTFNSGERRQVRLYAGLWGAKSGVVWLDDLRLEETGLADVLRRPGTPLTVRSEDGRTTYTEGEDFALVVDPELLQPHTDPLGPPIRLLPGSRIQEGERLRVSFYHAQPSQSSQISICMSEPKVYEIWETQARLVQQHLAPRKWFLSMDEVRAGGSCRACKERGLTMAQILGDCISRQMKLIRRVSPGAKVYCWSDMLDPNHNAHGDYYLVEGDFTGSWQYVPKDLIIACWWHEKRDLSLRFFSEHGFRTLGATYYDGDDLENCRDWAQSLRRTPEARGIMYTTWENKYALLPGFGDLVAAEAARSRP